MNEREKRDARESLYDDLANDRTTPEKAESKARELGLEPLTPALDPARFEPMREAHWTLAMAMAWIAWADLERVRDCLPRWRREHQIWVFRRYRTGSGIRAGYRLEREHEDEAAVLMMQLLETRDGEPGERPMRYTVKDAIRLLWEKLGTGDLVATTIFRGEPHVIPAHEWAHLESIESRGRDVLWTRGNLHGFHAPRYDSDVLVPRIDVLRLWPAQAPKRRGRKPGVGAEAETQIKAMRNEGVDVDAMGEKTLARQLGARGVKISPRQAGRKKKGA